MSICGSQVYSKISKRWVGEHILVWEEFMQHPVPEGCCIHHLDQDHTNNDILNLVCMTRSEHSRWHGKNMSEETRKKLSEVNKGKKLSKETKQKLRELNIGKKHSEEAKIKMSESHKNISEETKKKMSEAQKGNKNSLGHKHTEETKRKIGESKKHHKEGDVWKTKGGIYKKINGKCIYQRRKYE